jgi:hypothetical protein
VLGTVGAKVSSVFDGKPAVAEKEFDKIEPEESATEDNEPTDEQPDAETSKLAVPGHLPALSHLPPTLEVQGLQFLHENWEKDMQKLSDLCQKVKAETYNKDNLYKPQETRILLRTYSNLFRNLRDFFDQKTGVTNQDIFSAKPAPNQDAVMHTLDAICGTTEHGFEHDIVAPLGKNVQSVITNPTFSKYEKFTLLREMNNTILMHGRNFSGPCKNLFDYGLTPEILATIGLGYERFNADFTLLNEGISWADERADFVKKMEGLCNDPNASKEEKDYAEDMIFRAGFDDGLQKLNK